MALQRLFQLRFTRYFAASLVALAADTGCFLALLRLGLVPVASSAAGYALGIIVHWLISSRAVFSGHVAQGNARLRQKALFTGSALVGLAMTMLVVGVLSALGLDARAAKLVAIAASFTVTWLLRERVVFA